MSLTIAKAAAIARWNMEMEAEMNEVLNDIENLENQYLHMDEVKMNEIENGEEFINECMIVDEETGKEMCFDLIFMQFREVSNSTLYITNTNMDEMFPKLC